MDSEITKSPCESCGWFGWRSMNKERRVTLSELIEACGDAFFGLNRLSGNRWSCHFMEDENSSGEPVYLSPEEAVANLWLELHKK